MVHVELHHEAQAWRMLHDLIDPPPEVSAERIRRRRSSMRIPPHRPLQFLEAGIADGVQMRQLDPVLQRFGEQFLPFVSDPEAVACYRVVVSEAAHSDIGESFYETGPKRTIKSIGRYLAGAMDRKQLRRADPEIAAQHLAALARAWRAVASIFLA